MTTSPNERQLREWVVGIDLPQSSEGPARWALWLAERSAHRPKLIALHATDPGASDDEHPGPGPRDAPRVDPSFDAVRVVESDSAVDALLEAAGEVGTRGLIIGRHRPTDSWSLISLGRVARRVLRATDDAVFVVPPDHVPPREPGPIVVGVTPSDESRVAVLTAQGLGAQLDLRVECVHVLPNVSRFMTTPDTTATAFASAVGPYLSFEKHAREEMEAWMNDNDLHASLHIEVGDPAATLRSAAERLDASMLVAGSRQLSTFARLFQRSIGSDLASLANIPTLVVPPSPTAAAS